MSICEMTIDAQGSAQPKASHVHRVFAPKSAYHVVVTLVPEPGGGFSAYSPLLPGAHSQGETDAEAIENIRDAVRGLIEEYSATGTEIPWTSDDGERPADSLDRGILVHV
jgi:predicted RNase H-like HicB family nuclease